MRLANKLLLALITMLCFTAIVVSPTLAQTNTPTPSPSPTATPTVDPSITPYLTPNPIHTRLATPTPWPSPTPWPTATSLAITNVILPSPFTYTDNIITNAATITATPIYIYIFPTPYPTEIVPEPASTPVVCAPKNAVPVEGEVDWVAGVGGTKTGQKYPFQAKVLALSKKDIPPSDRNKYIYAYDNAISELVISTIDPFSTSNALHVIYHFQLGVELVKNVHETASNINDWWRFDGIRKQAVRMYKEDCGKFTVMPPDPIEPEEVTETISITLTDYVPNWITIPQMALIISGATSIDDSGFTDTISKAIPGTNLGRVAISITNFFTDCSTASGVYSHYSWVARMLPSADRKGIDGGQIIELAIGDNDTIVMVNGVNQGKVVYYFANGGIISNDLGSDTNAVVGAIVAQATQAYTSTCPVASVPTPGYISLNGIVAALVATNVLIDFGIVNTKYISAEIGCLESTNTFTLTADVPADPLWTGVLKPVGQFMNFFRLTGIDMVEKAAEKGLCETNYKYTFLGIPFPFQTDVKQRFYGSMFFSSASFFFIFKAFLLFTFDFIRSQYWMFKTNLGVVGIFIGWLFMMLPFVVSTRASQALIGFLVGLFNFLFKLAGFAYYLIDLSVNVPWAGFELLGMLAEWFLAGFWFAWLFIWRLWDFAIESWEAVPDTAQMFLLITGGITGFGLVLFTFIKPIAAFLLQLAGVLLGAFFIVAKTLGF